MRRRTTFVLTLLAAALATAGPPWLALHEARRQAYDTEAGLVLNYARDVLHRADETAGQALDAIVQLERAGLDSCTEPARAAMREIDLTSSYIQAVGHVRDGTMECSSQGGPPVVLDKPAFRTSRGVVVYDVVPRVAGGRNPLLGLARGGIIVLVHRDLPLDIWTAVPDVTLEVLHLEAGRALMARGRVDPAWLTHLGTRTAVTFVDGDRLVAMVRSQRFVSTAAVAAVPVRHLEQRVAAVAGRLVPVGLFVGLAAAAAILLLARRQTSMAAALRAGLRRDEFVLLYQPLIDLRSGACVGAEALLRWRRATGELIGPDLFIPVAEQSGLITRVTAHVLELIERDAGGYLARHPEFHIGINLAPADLRSHAIVGLIDTFLARTGARPANLIVEITERGFLDLDSARTVIAALRGRGIEVAIDDFGTGYSSLSYLETLDLDFLKIDRSFIEAIGTDAPTSQVVGHIMAMARTLDLRMIAEGVESDAQAAFLRTHDVQYAQGWLFGKPMPFADVAWLASSARPPSVQAGAA
jgi:sensor c-di-GMP phosphodiesterase-like protein